MLVLSRKIGESIVIGEGIVVKVLSTHGSYARIGVEAPKEVRVSRAPAEPEEVK
jgi:carbon storage regulator